MKKWKVKVPGGRIFEIESDNPHEALTAQGYTAFALEVIVPQQPRRKEIQWKRRCY